MNDPLPDYVAAFSCGHVRAFSTGAYLAPAERGQARPVAIASPCPTCALPRVRLVPPPPHYVWTPSGLVRLFLDGRCACSVCLRENEPHAKPGHGLVVTF
jgi:hypothetical protein